MLSSRALNRTSVLHPASKNLSLSPSLCFLLSVSFSPHLSLSLSLALSLSPSLRLQHHSSSSLPHLNPFECVSVFRVNPQRRAGPTQRTFFCRVGDRMLLVQHPGLDTNFNPCFIVVAWIERLNPSFHSLSYCRRFIVIDWMK